MIFAWIGCDMKHLAKVKCFFPVIVYFEIKKNTILGERIAYFMQSWSTCIPLQAILSNSTRIIKLKKRHFYLIETI